MIVINKRIIKEIWWTDGLDTNRKFPLTRYCQPNVEIVAGKKRIKVKEGETLISDLSVSEEQIIANFDATNRNSIRKVEKTGTANIKMFDSDALLKNKIVIKQFIQTFNTNYKILGLKARLNKKKINAYIHSKHFYLSAAYCENQPVIFHSYLANDRKCILLHSASYMRTTKSDINMSRNDIGLQNRYLHWKDILYFKGKGLCEYDWGGIFSSKNNENGIDKFKKQFNGKVASNKTILVANNVIGRLVMKILF